MASSLSRSPLGVVAAVIRRNGLILIGQRPLESRHGMKWEFPGGKVEPGEEPRWALQRELREELGIEAEIGAEITRYEYRYPQRSAIQLIFFYVDRFEGEPRNLAFHEIRWERLDLLRDYDFLEADIKFIKSLNRN